MQSVSGSRRAPDGELELDLPSFELRKIDARFEPSSLLVRPLDSTPVQPAPACHAQQVDSENQAATASRTLRADRRDREIQKVSVPHGETPAPSRLLPKRGSRLPSQLDRKRARRCGFPSIRLRSRRSRRRVWRSGGDGRGGFELEARELGGEIAVIVVARVQLRRGRNMPKAKTEGIGASHQHAVRNLEFVPLLSRGEAPLPEGVAVELETHRLIRHRRRRHRRADQDQPGVTRIGDLDLQARFVADRPDPALATIGGPLRIAPATSQAPAVRIGAEINRQRLGGGLTHLRRRTEEDRQRSEGQRGYGTWSRHAPADDSPACGRPIARHGGRLAEIRGSHRR